MGSHFIHILLFHTSRRETFFLPLPLQNSRNMRKLVALFLVVNVGIDVCSQPISIEQTPGLGREVMSLTGFAGVLCSGPDQLACFDAHKWRDGKQSERSAKVRTSPAILPWVLATLIGEPCITINKTCHGTHSYAFGLMHDCERCIKGHGLSWCPPVYYLRVENETAIPVVQLAALCFDARAFDGCLFTGLPPTQHCNESNADPTLIYV